MLYTPGVQKIITNDTPKVFKANFFSSQNIYSGFKQYNLKVEYSKKKIPC